MRGTASPGGCERYLGFITEDDAGYPIEDGPDTFTNGFEDFISQSRFAWGQTAGAEGPPLAFATPNVVERLVALSAA